MVKYYKKATIGVVEDEAENFKKLLTEVMGTVNHESKIPGDETFPSIVMHDIMVSEAGYRDICKWASEVKSAVMIIL